MGGKGNVFRVHPSIAGQGPVTWELITWDKSDDSVVARNNPNRSGAGMVEIVLYAKKPAGVK